MWCDGREGSLSEGVIRMQGISGWGDGRDRENNWTCYKVMLKHLTLKQLTELITETTPETSLDWGNAFYSKPPRVR